MDQPEPRVRVVTPGDLPAVGRMLDASNREGPGGPVMYVYEREL